jgi:release factor glutamine methyltransferase
MTVHDAIQQTSDAIARRDAETLLLHLLARDRAWLLAHPDAELSADTLATLHALTARRAAHEPLQYLTGTQEFFGLPLRVTRDTLIPRPETELLVEAVLQWCARRTDIASPRILDVGTGTGAIALALAQRLPSAHVIACDLSPAALDVARENAARLHLASRVDFVLSDLLDALAHELRTHTRFDVIVSNPPYVPVGDVADMQPEVRDHEPHTALFAGEDGLDIYRRLIPAAHDALSPAGLLALEFGFGQREALRSLLDGWSHIHFLDDYAGIPRIALAERAAASPSPPS